MDVDRLEATIEELLTLARGEREEGRTARPRRAARRAGRGWGGRLALQGRDLDLAVDRGRRWPASAAAVRQVLAVLVDNAARHGRGDDRAGTRGGRRRGDRRLRPGVRRARTGARPVRPTPAIAHPHGIGLARRLAEAENGRLNLTRPSPPVFTLLLPAAPDPVATGHVPAAVGDGR